MIRKLAGGLLAAAVLLTVLSGVGAAGAGTLVDATGKETTVTGARRVVAVGGSVTEIVYALGLGERLLAVDSTSLYPAAARQLPNVGYMRQLSAEPILALGPDLVLAIEDAGPQAALDQLRDAGLPVVLIPDEPTPEGALAKIDLVAAALDAGPAGRALRIELEVKLQAVREAFAQVDARPRVLFLLSIGNGRVPMAAGRDTSAAGIIELAGGENAIDAFESYKPLSPEAAVAAAPEVLLVTTRSLDLLGGREGLLQIPEIALTPAGRKGNIVVMDSLLLLGFGPRTAAAAAELGKRLHPAITVPLRSP
ncbi:heme/hemin ABC transporter substrate-binding protein [Pelagibius marinus]|uniref:heme/hemin ABC transporter substrate-binding protein n=1 Tax=Pelagibius marinus TaxID=2762760 RepID=UPI001872684B|nr:ABC transporter substrate-binding protein [Pelagibius marinus]